jgi:hypothetical protein
MVGPRIAGIPYKTEGFVQMRFSSTRVSRCSRSVGGVRLRSHARRRRGGLRGCTVKSFCRFLVSTGVSVALSASCAGSTGVNGTSDAATADGPFAGEGGDDRGGESMSDALAGGDDTGDGAREEMSDGGGGAAFDVAVVETGAGTCNAYAQMAPSIQDTCLASAIPAPQGGALSDGVYYETEFDRYTGTNGMTGACGMSHRFMALPSGTRLEIVSFDTTTMAEQRYTASLSTQGTTITWTFSCPAGKAPVAFGYDATPNKIVLHNTNNPLSATSFTLSRQ